jgi:hypothetical protein
VRCSLAVARHLPAVHLACVASSRRYTHRVLNASIGVHAPDDLAATIAQHAAQHAAGLAAAQTAPQVNTAIAAAIAPMMVVLNRIDASVNQLADIVRRLDNMERAGVAREYNSNVILMNSSQNPIGGAHLFPPQRTAPRGAHDAALVQRVPALSIAAFLGDVPLDGIYGFDIGNRPPVTLFPLVGLTREEILAMPIARIVAMRLFYNKSFGNNVEQGRAAILRFLTGQDL